MTPPTPSIWIVQDYLLDSGQSRYHRSKNLEELDSSQMLSRGFREIRIPDN